MVEFGSEQEDGEVEGDVFGSRKGRDGGYGELRRGRRERDGSEVDASRKERELKKRVDGNSL